MQDLTPLIFLIIDFFSSVRYVYGIVIMIMFAGAVSGTTS